jgi:hypothetical protein
MSLKIVRARAESDEYVRAAVFDVRAADPQKALLGAIRGDFIFKLEPPSSSVSELLRRQTQNAARVQCKVALVAEAMLQSDLSDWHVASA